MPSAVSREDCEAAGWIAGIRDPARMKVFLKTVDLYAYHVARKMATGYRMPLLEEDFTSVPDGECPDCGGKLTCSLCTGTRRLRQQYLCRACGTKRDLDQFPEAKRKNPAVNVSCLACGGRDQRKYKCIICTQVKFVDEFPEAKREHPQVPAACLHCAPKVITKHDAGFVLRK